MVFLTFSILIGAFFALALIAPSDYFLMLIILPLIGLFIMFIFKEAIKKPSKYILILLPFISILSYLVTSYITFSPKDINIISVKEDSLSSNKKAVILYADGEMEKYIPYFAGKNIINTPYILKPIESYKIKKAYDSIELSKKNIDIIKIATDFRESLLKNSPNYFYISYVNFTPSLKESINSALSDGCKDISILNFSNNSNASLNIDKIKDSLKINGIKIESSTPILKNLKPEFVLKSFPNDMSRFNAVLILDNTSLGTNIKQDIIKKGINESSIIVSNTINEGFSLLNDLTNESSNVLVINLLDFAGGILEKYNIENEMAKYEGINFEVLNPLKYDKDFLEIIVNEYKSLKK